MDATAVTLGQGHERSSSRTSTIPQTHIFFVPNIKGLAQRVLTWEGKVFAAADADAAETDWKHKVTPERGDLMNRVQDSPHKGKCQVWNELSQ